MRIGITGVTGMLGHHTALAALAAGQEPVLIHRPGTSLARIEDLPGERRAADVDDVDSMTAAFEHLDAVVHCAAYYPALPRGWRQDVEHARRQITAFVDACKRAAVPRIVYVGAAIALPRALSGEPAHAAMRYPAPPGDTNAYLQCKWLMDDYCLRAAQAGVPISIAIPGMTLGEYDWGPSTGQFITRIASREVRSFVEGKRNVIYAGDAGRGIVHVCQNGRAGERYLLTGANVTMSRLVEIIAQKTGVPTPRSVPLSAARAVARVQAWRYRVFGGEAPVINDTAIAVMSYGQFLSGEKAERELQFRAALRLEETVDRAIAWFEANGYMPQPPAA